MACLGSAWHGRSGQALRRSTDGAVARNRDLLTYSRWSNLRHRRRTAYGCCSSQAVGKRYRPASNWPQVHQGQKPCGVQSATRGFSIQAVNAANWLNVSGLPRSLHRRAAVHRLDPLNASYCHVLLRLEGRAGLSVRSAATAISFRVVFPLRGSTFIRRTHRQAESRHGCDELDPNTRRKMTATRFLLGSAIGASRWIVQRWRSLPVAWRRKILAVLLSLVFIQTVVHIWNPGVLIEVLFVWAVIGWFANKMETKLE